MANEFARPETGELAALLDQWRGWLGSELGLADIFARRSRGHVKRYLQVAGADTLPAVMALNADELRSTFAGMNYEKDLAREVWKALVRFFEFCTAAGLIAQAPIAHGPYPGKPARGPVPEPDLAEVLITGRAGCSLSFVGAMSVATRPGIKSCDT